jgi:hypothetical protein
MEHISVNLDHISIDYDTRISYSEDIFRALLINEYNIEEEKMEPLIENCKSSLMLRPPSPLYDIVFHQVVQDVLKSSDHNSTF